MPTQAEFTRALLALDLDAPDREAIAVATALAESLRLSLVGLFALDDTLHELAGYVGARELVPSSYSWRQIDVERLVNEQRLAAESARRLFDRLTGTAGVPSTFEIVSGSLGKALTAMSRASDILVVAESRRASASVTRSFSVLLDAAIHSTASMLFIPRSARVRKGPVVNIAGTPHDPASAIASTIARGARAELIRLEGLQQLRSLAAEESLIVVTRKGIGEADLAALGVAHQRRVPLLLLEPPLRSEVP